MDNKVLAYVNVSASIERSGANCDLRTDSNGAASLQISAAQLPTNAQFNASAGGFYPANVGVQISAAKTVTISLTPELESPQQLRVVMNWGKLPRDIDLHVIQTDKSTSKSCETYYSHMRGCSGTELDVDNTRGGDYGAETITFNEPQNKMFKIFVYKFSSDATPLIASQTRIALYGGTGPANTIRETVPTHDTNSHSR